MLPRPMVECRAVSREIVQCGIHAEIHVTGWRIAAASPGFLVFLAGLPELAVAAFFRVVFLPQNFITARRVIPMRRMDGFE